MTVSRCLFCLLFLLGLFSQAGTLSAQDMATETMELSLTILEEKLLSVEQDMIDSQKKMQNSLNYISLLEKQQKLSLDLLNREKENLLKESQRFEKLSKLSGDLGLEIARLKQSSTIKNWIIGGLAVSTIVAFVVGFFIGKNDK